MFHVNDIIFGQYEVRGWSEGGMGRVYFVFDQVTHDHVVVKMIKEDLKRQPDACRRFEREAKAWINLKDHPHIVRAMTFHREPIPCLFEEFIDGPSLNQLLKLEGAGLSFHQAVQFAIHVAKGLHHAHTRKMPSADGKVGIIHRDLKPHNILISRQCQAKIADFGLAKVVGENSPGSSQMVLGTIQYMPPEQLRDSKKVGFRSDLYSLGVTLYQTIAGRLPFPQKNYHEIAQHIEKSDPEPLSLSRPDVPARLQDFVYSCLRKKPSQRPASAKEVVRELEAIAALLPRAEAPPCANCGYVSREPRAECLVCGPPIVFPNSDLADAAPPAPPVDDGPTLWRCDCGHDLSLSFRYCIYCGRPQVAETTCPNCKAPNPSSHSYCVTCGGRLQAL